MTEPLRYLVIGCGRSGTGYVSRVLSDNKILCGHEMYFGPGGAEHATWFRGRFPYCIGESSWLAVPFTDLDWVRDAKRIHLVRDPKLVIPSLVRAGMFSSPYNAYSLFVFRHQPEISLLPDDPLTRCAAFAVAWIKRACSLCERTYHIESPIEQFFRKLGLSHLPKNLVTYHHYNGTGETQPLDLNKIQDAQVRNDVVDLLHHLGYANRPTHP